VKRPAVLLAVLVPLHLGLQRLLFGHVVPGLLVLPFVAVLAYEAADRAAARYARRRPSVDRGSPPGVDG
jgi:hypothetical protein